jgi:hypothetical protein
VFDPATTRAVWLVREYADGNGCRVGLLRSVSWVADQGIGGVGDWTELRLPEMGAEGAFQVVAYEPCPVIESGPGRTVTGVFHHRVGRVYDVRIEGESVPLGVTDGHPIWSVDRGDWVPVRDLQVGERVQGEGRTVTVAGIEEGEDEPVCNLEVDADHCYRVGEQGILVHNASCPNEILAGDAKCALFPSTFTGKLSLGFDSSGRAKGVQARLCKSNLEVGYAPSNAPGDSPKGWDEAGRILLNRGDILVRAHLLHEDLGGPGIASNLVVVCKTVNSRLYQDFEKILLEWIKSDSTVDIEVLVEYSGTSPYPKAIKAHAKRLNLQDSMKTNCSECDELRPGGLSGITATTDITTCNGAILR